MTPQVTTLSSQILHHPIFSGPSGFAIDETRNIFFKKTPSDSFHEKNEWPLKGDRPSEKLHVRP